MRIFVADASGVIGRQLVPLLVADGHQVTGMTRTPAAKTRGFLAQSIAWRLPAERQKYLDEFEQMVLSAGGVVLRYGVFYGSGTYHEATLPARPRIDVADAARRTVLLRDAPSGVIEIAE